MADHRPLISVVVICYNHERFVAECLDSVRAQSLPSVELVIVDDCSTDGSLGEIRSWLARTGCDAKLVVHSRNLGICRSRNDALRHVRGQFVSFISADDWWLPDKLVHQLEVLDRKPEAAIVYGDALQVDEVGSALPQTVLESGARGFAHPPEGRVYDELLAGQFVPPGPLVRLRCLSELGPYDESLAYEDWDMWLRLAERYDFAFSPSVDVVKRDVRGSLWKSLASTYKASDLRILLKHVDAHPELWHRIAVLAYETDDPNARKYYRARLRQGLSWRVLRFYLQSVVGLRHRQAKWVRTRLSALGRAHRKDAGAGGAPSTT